MTSRYIFFFILGIDVFILFSQTSQVSISHQEASLLYGDFSFLQLLVKTSLQLFGFNDFGLRFVMIFFHFMSVILIYLISFRYLSSQRNRLWLLLMYVLLPGVVSSAIMVNSAGLIIFGLLLYVYLSDRTSQILLNMLLLIYAIINVGFVYLFLALAIFYLFEKNRKLFLYNVGLYFLSSFIYGFDAVGYPSGHFLDTIGIYSAIFTPIIFIYIFYAIYRRYLTNRIDLLWYISATGFLFSLLLSFRQSVPIERFAPYLIIALPLAAQTFVHSYRIRLKQHRKSYRAAFIISFIFLILNTLMVFFNKELYLLIENPKKHFAYEMHIAKELSSRLRSQNINCVKTDEKMQLRLRYYGINMCPSVVVKEVDVDSNETSNVTIGYRDAVLYKASVTNVNN
jgi:hypothetical protein